MNAMRLRQLQKRHLVMSRSVRESSRHVRARWAAAAAVRWMYVPVVLYKEQRLENEVSAPSENRGVMRGSAERPRCLGYGFVG
jgi:hypothetical protein